MNKSTKRKVTAGVAISAGVAAASVAAVLLFGKNGKKHQKELKNWTVKMKNDVVKKAHEVKVVTAPVYKEIVNQVAEKYAGMKEVGTAELKKEVSALKKHWQDAVKDANQKSASMAKPKAKKAKTASKKKA